ncbi:peptide/nickel transport system permease protein [Microcella alkaliphila]|uniref:Peptide/nickel transport system permease protein n=1 Tax=Microcella alkaliphila TaxID=279828 RepID=A0A4Q7TS34_9MICO|nr:ABC transporter permease [Microcella alkaliphila]RZT62382.1 peptide/nickel transport system permease protein [Microcella alkaliphila]
MSTTPVNEPGHAEPGVTDTQSNLELKEVEGLSQGQIVRRRFFRHRGAVISMITLTGIILLAFSSVGLDFSLGGLQIKTPGWWQWTWTDIEAPTAGGRPTLSVVPQALGGDGIRFGDHPFGQDEVGRDIFAVVMRGTQQSIVIMFVVGAIAVAIGTVIGALAGFYRGWRDSVLMRFTDVIITIPVIVVGAVVGQAVGNQGAFALAIVLGLFTWTGLARLVRAEVLSLREREFVDAARVAGASDRRIVFKHILPNAIGVIIVNATLLMAAAILLETALSFLGFGVQSPDTSLGKIISDNQAAFGTRPWLFWWPGVFIIAIALCINFIGDGLRDAFDPRQKRLPSARALARAEARRRAELGR